jgi:8-oxo-dGTP diphosphatase
VADRKLGAAAVILDGEGHVLLAKHTYGKLNWELPGGGSEPDESVLETALREVREETGLDVVAERLTGIYFEPVDDMHHFVFLCRERDEAATPRLDLSEISAVGYWAPDSLPRSISDFTIRRIQDALAGPSSLLPVIIEPRRLLVLQPHLPTNCHSERPTGAKNLWERAEILRRFPPQNDNVRL